MKNFIEVSNGQVGFGVTREAAKRDLLINKCRQDINEDLTGEFRERRKELHPWLPKDNMLHINGLGCLVYNNYKLTNTKTGKTIPVTQAGKTIYYYMANMFRNELSYTDVTVVLRPELDKLFGNISNEFTLIKDMPYIKLSNRDNGFSPNVVYTTKDGVIIGVGDKEIGMKYIGDDMYHVVELDNNFVYIPILSYIGYKMNIIFTDGGIDTYGKED